MRRSQNRSEPNTINIISFLGSQASRHVFFYCCCCCCRYVRFILPDMHSTTACPLCQPLIFDLPQTFYTTFWQPACLSRAVSGFLYLRLADLTGRTFQYGKHGWLARMLRGTVLLHFCALFHVLQTDTPQQFVYCSIDPSLDRAFLTFCSFLSFFLSFAASCCRV